MLGQVGVRGNPNEVNADPILAVVVVAAVAGPREVAVVEVWFSSLRSFNNHAEFVSHGRIV